MFGRFSLFRMLASIASTLLEVGLFWQLRLYAWWTRKKPRDTLLETLGDARIYEEWEGAAFQLDELLGNDIWRQNPASKYYDYRLIYERLQAIIEAREDEDIPALVNLLRSGLVRNLGNLSAPRLFNRAYAGTKLLIEDYITQVALAIEYVTTLPTSSAYEGGLTNQAKLDLFHDTRQAFGRSTLVLQGGAIFGLYHLGVVKALHLRGLLPRIIVGTATGALIAALVGIHTEEELLGFLDSDAIDLSAFAQRSKEGQDDEDMRDRDLVGLERESQSGWIETLVRRVKRFIKEGYFLDVRVLEDCVRANVGDLTFEEAYSKTKRVLNITLNTTGRGDMPNLLNYLTAPHVLIWSAAVASNASSSSTLYSPVSLQCKDPTTGLISPWTITATATTTISQNSITPRQQGNKASYTPTTDTHDSPLTRIAELFNVNHFIVSRATPPLLPFLSPLPTLSPTPTPNRHFSLTHTVTLPFLRLLSLEVSHRLSQLDTLSLLPTILRPLLLNDDTATLPAASLTLVPELTTRDFVRLFETPTREALDYWILRGERSVWPAVGLLKVRCAVEVELDRGYQLIRRGGGRGLGGGGGGGEVTTGGVVVGSDSNGHGDADADGDGTVRKRTRAASDSGA
ncbi:MAG: hypothetical protein M1819_000791 [Sarea resinae]|nr:MAG: hypothetical protein M1819_000791 [Sarea resinae]